MNKPTFRAWWIKEKEMHNVCKLDFKNNQVDFCGADTVKIADIILMQSTGLKDKNGVEIFEGDILKIIEISNEGMEEYLTDVFWEDASFVLKSNGVDYYDTFLAAWSGDPDKIYPLFELEVIGNIHANPELLNEVSG